MMKISRILAVLLAAIMLFSSFSVFAEYNLDDYPFDRERKNPKIPLKANEGSPTIDGNITTSEGWGDAVTFNHKNLLQFWAPSSRCIINADVRMAWDDAGLYISADITDPTMIATTGEDGTNVDFVNDTNGYGWNGDVFIFALDPQGKFFDEGFAIRDWYSAWYCFGVDADGKAKCYVTQSTYSGDITSRIEIGGALNADGWCFEAKLPWDRLAMDTEDVTYGEVTLNKDEFTQLGTKSRAGIMYMDRAVYNEETSVFSNTEYEEGEIFTISRSICVPTVHEDGMNYNNGGPSAYSYGIELVMADSSGYAPDVVIEHDHTDDPDEESDYPAMDETKGIEPYDPTDNPIILPDLDYIDLDFGTEETTDTTSKQKSTKDHDDEESDNEDNKPDSSLSTVTVIATAAAIILGSGIIIAVVISKKIKSNK